MYIVLFNVLNKFDLTLPFNNDVSITEKINSFTLRREDDNVRIKFSI